MILGKRGKPGSAPCPRTARRHRTGSEATRRGEMPAARRLGAVPPPARTGTRRGAVRPKAGSDCRCRAIGRNGSGRAPERKRRQPSGRCSDFPRRFRRDDRPRGRRECRRGRAGGGARSRSGLPKRGVSTGPRRKAGRASFPGWRSGHSRARPSTAGIHRRRGPALRGRTGAPTRRGLESPRASGPSASRPGILSVFSGMSAAECKEG